MHFLVRLCSLNSPECRSRRIWSVAFLIAVLLNGRAVAAEPEAARADAKSKLVTMLKDKAINESSGLAASRLRKNVFWTHNDSGDSPRLYAFDTSGTTLGTVAIAGARAVDWEDMCSFVLDGRAYLLVGDVGDNELYRRDIKLYLVEEPAAEAREAAPVQTVPLEYAGGPRNCEALAFDPVRREAVLISKVFAGKADVFVLPWPKDSPREPVVLEARQFVPHTLVTACDISSDGRRAVVLTYTHSYEYTRGAEEDWVAAFGRAPRVRPMPVRLQGESICYGPEGNSLFLTSERLPVPLWQVEAP